MSFEFVSQWANTWLAILQLAVAGAFLAALILFRYLLISGAGFGLGMITERLAPWRRLQSLPFSRAQISREIGYSFMSVLVFMIVVAAIYFLTQAGLTQLYRDVDQFGWAWFWLQIPVILLIQDWYFYWMHRAVHTEPFYDRVHKAHHLSTNPSAFSAFAFHPLEAVLEAVIFVVLVVIMPLNVVGLITAGIVSLVYNVYGHLGYEIMPRFLAKSWIGHWLNKSSYHNQHHRTYRYNYGLYTVIWDRLHGTMHPKAEHLYDGATTQPSEVLERSKN